jgi:hypothetical protein
MKVRRRLLNRSCAAHSSLVQTLGVQAQMRLKISPGDSK